jgi:hypothetical protein
MTVVFLVIFLLFRWSHWRTIFADVRLYPFSMNKKVLNPTTAALIMFSGALVAIVCAPGLHPQF